MNVIVDVKYFNWRAICALLRALFSMPISGVDTSNPFTTCLHEKQLEQKESW
ncbi:hypothetical protein SB00610_00337 [Klebsiella quasipneumoniae subsp. similipneumoniae]|nr:hypothetical protein SB00610_00337 [Klebsiella quasipneumoniae subsp. similipneumoniae]